MAQFAERISLTRDDTLTALTKKISMGEDSTIELKRALPHRDGPCRRDRRLRQRNRWSDTNRR